MRQNTGLRMPNEHVPKTSFRDFRISRWTACCIWDMRSKKRQDSSAGVIGNRREARFQWREWETVYGVKSIFTETLVKRLPRKMILDLKMIDIKVEWAVIIMAKTLNRKKIGFHRRDMQDFTKIKEISRGSELRITNVGDGKVITISNGDKLWIRVGVVVRYVVKVRGEVIDGTSVRDPGSWVRIRWCGGGHGSELYWRMPALVGVIHALITINRCMSRLVADLAGRTRTRAWIPRLGILGILTEVGEYKIGRASCRERV